MIVQLLGPRYRIVILLTLLSFALITALSALIAFIQTDPVQATLAVHRDRVAHIVSSTVRTVCENVSPRGISGLDPLEPSRSDYGIATIISSMQHPYAMALAHSLPEDRNGRYPVYVLFTDGALPVNKTSQELGYIPLLLSTLCEKTAPIVCTPSFRFQYTQEEFSKFMQPIFLHFLFHSYENLTRILLVEYDSWFLRSPNLLFQQLDRGGFAFATQMGMDIEKLTFHSSNTRAMDTYFKQLSTVYNSGFIGIRRTEESQQVLTWIGRRLLDASWRPAHMLWRELLVSQSERAGVALMPAEYIACMTCAGFQELFPRLILSGSDQAPVIVIQLGGSDFTSPSIRERLKLDSDLYARILQAATQYQTKLASYGWSSSASLSSSSGTDTFTGGEPIIPVLRWYFRYLSSRADTNPTVRTKYGHLLNNPYGPMFYDFLRQDIASFSPTKTVTRAMLAHYYLYTSSHALSCHPLCDLQVLQDMVNASASSLALASDIEGINMQSFQAFTSSLSSSSTTDTAPLPLPLFGAPKPPIIPPVPIPEKLLPFGINFVTLDMDEQTFSSLSSVHQRSVRQIEWNDICRATHHALHVGLPVKHASVTIASLIEPAKEINLVNEYFFTVVCLPPAYASTLIDRSVSTGRYFIPFISTDWPALEDGSRMFQAVQEIWTPSSFAQSVWAASLISPVLQVPVGPIENPHGLPNASSHNHPHGENLVSAITNLEFKDWQREDYFIFLTFVDLAAPDELNNLQGAVAAFEHAFAREGFVFEEKQVCLFVLTANFPLASASGKAALNQADAGRRVNIIHTNGTSLSDHLMEAAYSLARGYISLHRSTSYGMHILQAMAHGLPVVATSYSGTTQYMTSGNSLAVNFLRKPVDVEVISRERLQPTSIWAEPDQIHAASLLRWIVSNPEKARAIGDHAKEDVERILQSSTSQSKQMEARLQFVYKLMEQKRQKP